MRTPSLLGTRLLALVCFFHFSGINNGYTTLAQELPSAPSSVFLLNRMIKAHQVLISPGTTLTLFSNFLQSKPRPYTRQSLKRLRKSAQAVKTLSTRHGSHIVRGGLSLGRQVSYRNVYQNSWIKRELKGMDRVRDFFAGALGSFKVSFGILSRQNLPDLEGQIGMRKIFAFRTRHDLGESGIFTGFIFVTTINSYPGF